MLVLAQSGGRYPDDHDAALRWVPPDGLAPVLDTSGTPEVYVARDADGGVLTLRLQAQWPVLGANERATRHTRARFRLRSGIAGSRIDAGWHDAPTSGSTIVDRSVALDPVEAAMIRKLAASGGESVDVDVALSLEGALPTWPWLVRIDGQALQSRLAAVLGSATVDFAAVLDAFAGLGNELFEWRALQPHAIPPPADAAREAIAHHASAYLLTPLADGFQLRSDVPAQLDVSLAVHRTARTELALVWSLSQFIAAQPEPGKHLLDARAPDPFQAAELHVANDVPLAEDGVRRIELEITTGGPTGALHHAFELGAPSAVRLPFVRQGPAPLALRWLARATVVVGSGPTIVETSPRATGPMLELDAAALGIVPLCFVADPIVFTRVAALEVKIGTRTLALTAARPRAWAIGRTPPPTVEVSAVDAAGARTAMGPFPLVPGGRTFGALELGIGEPVGVQLVAPDALWSRAAYLAVQVESGPWQTLDRGDTIAWPTYREDRFTPPKLRYRTRHVPRDAAGATAPITESPLRDASGERIELELPT